MQDRLLERLNSYITEDHPDLLSELCSSGSLQSWLLKRVQSADLLISQLRGAGKSESTIEEAALDAITRDLRPSRFHYIAELLEEDFAFDYYRMRTEGTLAGFLYQMTRRCSALFQALGFSEDNEHDPCIRASVRLVLVSKLNTNQSNISHYE